MNTFKKNQKKIRKKSIKKLKSSNFLSRKTVKVLKK